LPIEVTALVLFCALGLSAFGEERVWRFDCGTADSPVAAGYQRLTADDMYDAGRGYGWEGAAPGSAVFGESPVPEGGGSLGRPGSLRKYLQENFTDLSTDGVVSEEDLVFRIDVPKGKYSVKLTIGDMSTPLGSIDLYLNEQLAGDDVVAWAVGSYRFLLVGAAGWWTHVHDTVDASEGFIRIALKKDQSYYDEQLAAQVSEGSPITKYWNEFWTFSVPPYSYIGWPFVRNSIMAIEIVPEVAPVVEGKDDRLSLTRRIVSPALEAAIEAFNKGDFAAALSAVERVTEVGAEPAKALLMLWLAGRPEVEAEQSLVPTALATLREYVHSHPEESRVAAILEDAETFDAALNLHLKRGDPEGFPKNHFVENGKAVTLWFMIREGSPLYYKSRVYIARAAHMLLPYIPAVGGEQGVLRELERKFPDNRYVKYLMHWEWEPHGDGTSRDDWYLVDYAGRNKDAPAWARELQACYGLLVDWAEWWIKFKQREDGSIGGGWGDDVEVGPAFGAMEMISRGVSELTMEGMRRLVNGVWYSSEVDPELGYCLPMADTGHSAEWTGNTLGMMVRVDYGNPMWIERGMKTGKLMRDLWTGYNDKGNRHFRSNMLGASQVGSGDQMNDAWINLRGVPPAAAVLRYNHNPTLSKLFVELADAWVYAARSTERGKPRGVIPGQVSFPEGIIGGTNSPNWYTASHSPGTDNSDWAPQSGKFYIHELLTLAYELTRDAKYFEPMRLEYELGSRYDNPTMAVPSTRLGTPPWKRQAWDMRDGLPLVLEDWQTEAMEESLRAGRKARSEGPEEASAPVASEQWVSDNLVSLHVWLRAKSLLEGRDGALANDVTKEDIVTFMSFYNKMLRMHWPLVTTEASATDRVNIGGLLPMFFIYTGGRRSSEGITPAITYENTTKDFAAAVMALDSRGFRMLYYSMAPETRKVGIVPWELELGGVYRLRYGPDADEDEEMDRVVEERQVELLQRGTPMYVSVEPRKTYVIEVEQVEPGKGATLAPDPGLSPDDIRYNDTYNLLLVTVHNVGSEAVRNVRVAAYDGDPREGGTSIGSSVIANLEAPNDLQPEMVTVGFGWTPTPGEHEVYVVVDPDDEIKDEITTFNNLAHKVLPEKEKKVSVAPRTARVVSGGGR